MQFFADYFPLVLFFVAFKLQGIYVATAVAIAASVAQIAWFRWKRGKVAVVHWLSHALKGIELPDVVWSRLTWAWITFFAAMAVANWYVAFHFTTDTWVNFKV